MTVAPATSSTLPWQPVRQADATLVAQLAEGLARRIDEQGLRPGTACRPSARWPSNPASVVSPWWKHTTGWSLAGWCSRGAERFFVRARSGPWPPSRPRCPYPGRAGQGGRLAAARMFRETSVHGMPGGAGLLPPDWLDPEMVAGAVRAVGRSVRGQLVSYGHPQGFLPLRQQIAASLQGEGVPAHPERNLLTTNGVTHALDLIARHLVKPGDTVLVEDPAWFLIFGRLAAFGARLIGVPRGPDGPDTALLDQLAAEHKPKLFIINSAVHNPTGHTLSAGIAYEILRIAERHDFLVVEDDTYGDLHPGGAMKLAVLDRLRRVILVSGYSKMLAASLRVGYVAAHPDILQKLADLKMLAGLTSPELGERVIHRVLMEGQYRRHAERVRARVDEAAGAACKG